MILLFERFRGIERGDAAVDHYGDPVAILGFVKVMRGDEYCHPF